MPLSALRRRAFRREFPYTVPAPLGSNSPCEGSHEEGGRKTNSYSFPDPSARLRSQAGYKRCSHHSNWSSAGGITFPAGGITFPADWINLSVSTGTILQGRPGGCSESFLAIWVRD